MTLTSTSGPTAPAAIPADLATALTATLHDSTGTGTGSVDWSFAIADQDLDFLADGETLMVNYSVAVGDDSTSESQAVSVVITGSNDAVAVTSGPDSADVEQVDTTGSSTADTANGGLSFADVDLNDTHSVSVTLTSAVLSGDPDYVPPATGTDLETALATASPRAPGAEASAGPSTSGIATSIFSPPATLTAICDVTVFDGTTSSTRR